MAFLSQYWLPTIAVGAIACHRGPSSAPDAALAADPVGVSAIAWHQQIATTHRREITGRVVEVDSLRPLSDAAVWVYDSTGTRVAQSRVGENGKFTDTLIRAGTFRVRVLRIGYAGLDTRVTVRDDGRVVLTAVLAPDIIRLQ